MASDPRLKSWAEAKIYLRISDDEFWSYSKEELDALWDAWKEKMERDNELKQQWSAWMLANIGNIMGGKKNPLDERGDPVPFEIEDFLPETKEKKTVSEEEMLTMVMNWNAKLGGTIE